MENLFIKSTKYTPQINFDAQKGILDIQGRSYPENTVEFYTPILQWLENYLNENIKKEIIVNLEIIYLNSGSSKIFFDFFDLIEEAFNKGTKVEINWIYDEEDESSEDMGMDYKEDFESINFNLIKKHHYENKE